MIQACIFDLDGTLANTLDSLEYFGNTALLENGYPCAEKEKYKTFIGDGADMLIRRMLADVAGEYTEEEVMRVRKSYDKLYAATPLYLTTIYDGIQELLQMLKENGIKCAVLSNKPHDMTKMVVRSFFGEDTFDIVRGQQAGVEKKPSPQGAQIIAEKWKIPPEEILYIGDTNVDMQTGKGANMVTIGVLWGFRDRKELEESSAQYIVETPAEIFKIARP